MKLVFARKIVGAGVLISCFATQIAGMALEALGAGFPRYDVYLLVGQSNMCGRGQLPATSYDLTNVQIWNGSAWVQAVEPFFHDADTSGAGLAASFARKMADAESDVVVRLVPAAVGNTGMSRWIPEGDLYQAAVAMTCAAVANGGGTLKGILWHQGEADSGSTANAMSYAASFTRMVNQFRADLGNVASDPMIPVVAGELGRYFGNPDNPYCTYWETVNNQLRTVAKTMENVYLISSEGLTPKNDNIHFDTPSLRTLGERYSVAFLDPSSLPVLEPPELPPPLGSDQTKNVSTFDYVQDGLVAQWDGLENAGRLQHSDAITVWKDIVGGSEIELTSGKSLVGANFVQVLKSKEISGSCPELGIDRPKTIEICAHCVEMNNNPDSYLFMNNGHKYIGVSRGVSSGYQFTYDNGANTRIYKKGISTVDTSAIHTFSCGYPGTTLSLGYDGQYVTLPAGNANTASATRSCLEAFTLGKEDPKSPRLASYEYYSLRIYSRLLTAEEIAHNHAIDVARFVEGKARLSDYLYVRGVPADFGRVSPAYGLHMNVLGGTSFTGSAEDPIPIAQTNITCLGYVVYTNGAYGVGQEYQQGTTPSFTYVQPAKTVAELVWKWGLTEDLLLPKVVDVIVVNVNSNGVIVCGNLAELSFASCRLAVVIEGDGLTAPLVFEGLEGSERTATGAFSMALKMDELSDLWSLQAGKTYRVRVLATAGEKRAQSEPVEVVWAISAASYVQDGLVAQWDGKENLGHGQHAATLAEWVDLVGTNRIMMASGAATVNEDNITLATKKTLSGTCAELAPAGGPGEPVTIECYASSLSFVTPDSQGAYMFFNDNFRYIQVDSAKGYVFHYLVDNAPDWTKYRRNYKYTGANLRWNSGYHTLSYGFLDVGRGLALSVDGNDFNGSVANSGDTSAFPPKATIATTKFYLGKDGRTGSYSYRSLRIYSRLLTAGEIRQNRWIDQIRYEGAKVESLLPEGTRMLANGTVQYRVDIDAHGAGVRFGGSAETFAVGKHTWWKPLPSAKIEAEPRSGWLYGWVGAPQVGARWTDDGATMTWDIDGALSLYLDAFEPSASVLHIAPGESRELASLIGIKALHIGALQGETAAATCMIGGQIEVTAKNGGYAIVESRGGALRKTTFTLLNGGTLKLLSDAEFYDLEMPDATDKLDLNGFKLSLCSSAHRKTGWSGQVVDSSAGKTGRLEWAGSGFMLTFR